MSDCDFCVSVGDYESGEFVDVDVRVARKEHKCHECRRTIQPGDTYERVSGKWDGEFDSFATCMTCVEIRGAFFCDGWVYGSMWEDLSEQLMENLTTGCLEKLETPEAKKYLVERWQRWKGLVE